MIVCSLGKKKLHDCMKGAHLKTKSDADELPGLSCVR